MIQTNVRDAQANLAQLLEKAIAGEDVIIEADEHRRVKLIPVENAKDWFGMDEGKGWIADDFDELPKELLDAFYGETEK